MVMLFASSPPNVAEQAMTAARMASQALTIRHGCVAAARASRASPPEGVPCPSGVCGGVMTTPRVGWREDAVTLGLARDACIGGIASPARPRRRYDRRMPDYHLLRRDEMEFTPPSRGDQRRRIQRLSPMLSTSRANIWLMPPGARGRRHRETDQEELFVALEGTAMLYLGDPPERVDLPQGSVLVLPVGTPVQLVNEGDEDSLVLIIGAPPVAEPGEYLPDVPAPTA
jgi:mannose-6-phosphate isomerase-like protein (cupin superfamily)